jgi:hypothetical protein
MTMMTDLYKEDDHRIPDLYSAAERNMNHFISNKDPILRSNEELETHLVNHRARTESLYVVRDGLDDSPCSPIGSRLTFVIR